MNAHATFRAEISWLLPDVSLALRQELDRACFLAYKSEPILLARLEDGTRKIEARYGELLAAPQKVITQWTAILIAWHCCYRQVIWSDYQNKQRAAEAAALPTVNRQPGMLGKAT